MKKILSLATAMLAFFSAGNAITLTVEVPEGSKRCYVCGDFNNWDVNTAPELSPAGTNLFSVDLPDVSDAQIAKGYKYLSGRDWLYVEKDATGGEIDNRTVPGNPDKVGSWRSLPEWDVETVEITVNGLPRQIKVYLPDGYAESTESYPVIYYNTVQQRYSNAGDDGDNGDYLFSPNSWNAHNTMETLRSEGVEPYVMVQICSVLSENTVEEHPDYTGTGAAQQYLDAFIGELMPYVESHWRVKTGKENTVIMGADYGALFSLYAALSSPDIFGKSVVMSPMLWINEGAYVSLTALATPGQSYLVTVGSKEPGWMIEDARDLAQNLSAVDGVNANFHLFEGAAHNDDDWGKCFPTVLRNIALNILPETPQESDPEESDSDFENSTFILYGGTTSGNLAKIGELVYTREFYTKKNSVPQPAFVITHNLGTEYKSKYYWNVKKGDENGEWILDKDGEVGFSSSKTTTSWNNVAVLADESVQNVAANSQFFKVAVGNNTTTMSPVEDHVVEATVSFPDNTKTFAVKFGSVNSGSDQGELTAPYSVSDNCIEAEITYDFNLNKVTVKETKFGDLLQEEKPDFNTLSYSLYGGEDSGKLEKLGDFTYTADYNKKGTQIPSEAFVITVDIPAKYQGTYYWNIARGDSDAAGWHLDSHKTIGFSNKKTETSWFNVAVYPDGTVDNIAAHSKGFSVKTTNGSVAMAQAGGNVSKATVSFPTEDKGFEIHFGSVNSASDMGAISPSMSVSKNCLEAEISYDFHLNSVTVAETKFGEVEEQAKIKNFSAVPSVGIAGSDVDVKLELNKDCNVAITCKNAAGNSVPFSLQKTGAAQYGFTLAQLPEGVYTLALSITDGNVTTNDAAVLNVKMLPESEKGERELTVNAYENIDWAKTGRYKANFHTHTSVSFDTQYTPTEVVDKYQKANYQILALTDHDANPYPWSMFSLYNPAAQDRDAAAMGMLSIPGNELSKDRRNNWSETTGGEFNHHNDFFTGRKGQEFMSLRESYAYSYAIGGLQIINHPGQYWNLSTEYKAGEKNSPEWHAENFNLYPSLIGLEVYNQGNRRPNDRILWDQILTLTMPDRPVWGYSCDDTHTAEQYFRNYQYMLMPTLSVDALKEAMNNGTTVFSYEFTGSGEALAPYVNSVEVDKVNQKIIIDTDDADNIEWLYSTYRTGSAASTTKSCVVGYGKEFDYSGYQGSYVRARLTNKYGETALQPFGFESQNSSSIKDVKKDSVEDYLTVINTPGAENVTVICSEPMLRISVINAAGNIVRYLECDNAYSIDFGKGELPNGVYVIVAATEKAAYTGKFIK